MRVYYEKRRFIINEELYLRKYWARKDLSELQNILQLPLDIILKLAIKNKLYQVEYKSEQISSKRYWSLEEEDFLKSYSDRLTITQASNLLKRSRYATYQRIRYLGLDEMINKK